MTATHHKLSRSMKAVFALIAAAGLLLFLLLYSASLEVNASHSLLYSLSPSLAMRLKPERHACISGGFELKLLSAESEDNDAQVMISLQELEGKPAIPRNIDSYYRVQAAFPAAGHCEMVNWDAENGIAVYQWQFSNLNDAPLSGQKISFSLPQIPSETESTFGELEITFTMP